MRPPFILCTQPFLLFFACFYSFSFMEIISPLLIPATVQTLNVSSLPHRLIHRNERLDDSLLCIWSCMLLCGSCPMQYEYTKRLLEVVEGKLVNGKEWFHACFSKVSVLCCNKLIKFSMSAIEQQRIRPMDRSIGLIPHTVSLFHSSFDNQRQEKM